MTIAKIRHSTIAGRMPTSLQPGELALNIPDRGLYYNDPNLAAPAGLLDQLAALSAYNNLVINGGMEVDQVHIGAAVTGIQNASQYAIDMVQIYTQGANILTTQQVTDAPPGFSRSIRFSVTTQNASPGSTDAAAFLFPIEGYRIARLGYGATGALNIGIGFWVKANRTGVYGLNVSNAANNRGYSTSFTVAASSVWQWITATIPGDVTGTWLNTNAKALIVSVWMMAGSGLQMVANTWTAGGFQGVQGQINGVAALSDFMQITGLCVFPGYIYPLSARSPALFLPFSDTVIQCQRYYWKTYAYATALAATTSVNCVHAEYWVNNISNNNFRVKSPVTMMATPSVVTIYSPVTGTSAKARDNLDNTDNTASLVTIGTGPDYVTINVLTVNDISFHLAVDARM